MDMTEAFKLVHLLKLKDGRVGLLDKPPRTGFEIGRTFLSVDRRIPGAPTEIAVWNACCPGATVEGSDEDSRQQEPFSPDPVEIPRDKSMIEGLFAHALRRRLPTVAMGAASTLMALDFLDFANLLTVMLPVESALHPKYIRLTWTWLAVRLGQKPTNSDAEFLLTVVREAASCRFRESLSVHRGIDAMEVEETVSSLVHFDQVHKTLVAPFLIRVLADNAATPSNRLKRLVRTELRDSSWQDLLLRTAFAWHGRCSQDKADAERWSKEPERWHRNVPPVHTGSQFYGSDLWESFMLPEAVCAKVDGLEEEFAREAVDLAKIELEPPEGQVTCGNTYESIAKTFLARWRNWTPRVCVDNEEMEPVPDFVATDPHWSSISTAFECLAYRRWMTPIETDFGRKPKLEPNSSLAAKRSRSVGTEVRLNGEASGATDNTKNARVAKQSQKSIWDFIRN